MVLERINLTKSPAKHATACDNDDGYDDDDMLTGFVFIHHNHNRDNRGTSACPNSALFKIILEWLLSSGGFCINGNIATDVVISCVHGSVLHCIWNEAQINRIF